MSATLYVSNLPHDVCKADLLEIFSTAGEVVDTKVQRSWGTLEVSGYVTMKDVPSAQRAGQLFDGHLLYGQPIQVKKAHQVVCRGAGRRPALLQ
jgi:RNA recognition motif-containing protein